MFHGSTEPGRTMFFALVVTYPAGRLNRVSPWFHTRQGCLIWADVEYNHGTLAFMQIFEERGSPKYFYKVWSTPDTISMGLPRDEWGNIDRTIPRWSPVRQCWLREEDGIIMNVSHWPGFQSPPAP